MAKLRKGRLVVVVLGLGAVAWVAVTLNTDTAGVEVAADQAAEGSTDVSESEPEQKQSPPEPSPDRSRTHVAAGEWAVHLEQLASLLEDYPGVTVHRMKTYANGTLRLECSARGGNLRDVALFRDALKSSALCSDSVMSSKSVSLPAHSACILHGDVKQIMLFKLDLAPREPVPAGSGEPGSLHLVAQCKGID